MRTLHKRLQDYKKATKEEPERLWVIEAMEKIITVVEEHLALARSRRIVVSTMNSFLHDATDILEEGAKHLRLGGGLYEYHLGKYNKIIEEIRALVSLPSPAQALLMPLPEKPTLGTDTDMQEKEI